MDFRDNPLRTRRIADIATTVRRLPKGAEPLDFRESTHSELGKYQQTEEARRVQDQIVPRRGAEVRERASSFSLSLVVARSGRGRFHGDVNVF